MSYTSPDPSSSGATPVALPNVSRAKMQSYKNEAATMLLLMLDAIKPRAIAQQMLKNVTMTPTFK